MISRFSKKFPKFRGGKCPLAPPLDAHDFQCVLLPDITLVSSFVAYRIEHYISLALLAIPFSSYLRVYSS